MTTTRKKVIFYDFDGTIIEEDIGRIMVPELAPKWWSHAREIYPLVLSGEMGSRSWYYWKFLKAKIKEEAYFELVNKVNLTAGFLDFYEFICKQNYEFVVLSDGFESYIKMVFDRLRLEDLKIYSNILKFASDSLKLEFPYHNSECGYCALCKAEVVASFNKRGYESIFIGDGIGDVFAAEASHKVFAKGSLVKQCGERGIKFTIFEDFRDIMTFCKNDFKVEGNVPSFHPKCRSLQSSDIKLSKLEPFA